LEIISDKKPLNYCKFQYRLTDITKANPQVFIIIVHTLILKVKNLLVPIEKAFGTPYSPATFREQTDNNKKLPTVQDRWYPKVLFKKCTCYSVS
jgi:hypothetical protein